MNYDDFLKQLDEAPVVAAIQKAEARTSGEIRVDVAQQASTDPLALAEKRFTQLGMEKTRDRNGVLILFVPRAQQFAVFGDTAVHQRCGDTFWRDVAGAMTPLLRENKFTEAVELAVQRVGAVLAEHFPRKPDDQNELPDGVTRS